MADEKDAVTESVRLLREQLTKVQTDLKPLQAEEAQIKAMLSAAKVPATSSGKRRGDTKERLFKLVQAKPSIKAVALAEELGIRPAYVYTLVSKDARIAKGEDGGYKVA
jgi:hypothetical protein